MNLVVTWLALALVPAAVAGFVNCQTSCKRCQENSNEPEVVELYCSMCEECREKRRERLARRGLLGHGPGHHVPAVGRYKDSEDILPAGFAKALHRKPRVDRRSPLRTYHIPSAVTPAYQMHHYYTQRQLRPLRKKIPYENLDPKDVEFLQTIPDGCPTPPICEDPLTEKARPTTTSTAMTTTTTTTPAPTCPPIPDCVATTTSRPAPTLPPQTCQSPPSPPCLCMPMCIMGMSCPCPCQVHTKCVTTTKRTKPTKPTKTSKSTKTTEPQQSESCELDKSVTTRPRRPKKTTHVVASDEAEEDTVDKKSDEYVNVYVGVPKNLNKSIK